MDVDPFLCSRVTCGAPAGFFKGAQWDKTIYVGPLCIFKTVRAIKEYVLYTT
jgi:hypothetical protein